MNTVGGRNAPPLSPVSAVGSDWSVSKYQADDNSSYPPNRANLASPPNSGSSNGNMSMNGFASGPRSTGGPSPPPSVGRSSNGTNNYPRSDSLRSNSRSEMDEAVLGEHYSALRTFLLSRDPNPKQQPNKARDKLLRLSSVQFYELSTDVFDELIRRQAVSRAPPNIPNGPPPFLPPEKTFHPKRNQARQRLSSLGPPRFRDLAADVFHELERRFPQFAGGGIPRAGSAMSNRGGPTSRTGTPVNGLGYPQRGPDRRRPSDASSARGPPPLDAYGVPPSPGLPPGDYGRPMQRQLNQNNTIIPNKSTMVEEDDDGGQDDDASDTYGAARAINRASKRSAGSGAASETDKKLIDDYQTQVRELREKLDGMEDAMRQKDDQLSSALEVERSKISSLEAEKEGWAGLRIGLENKLAEAQNLNDTMKQELDRMRDNHLEETRQLQDQVVALQDTTRSLGARVADSDLQQENEDLRNALEDQEQMTQQVRQEAQGFLQEMRQLSQQSTSTYERQLELERQVERLESEVQDWRNKFARTKTQLRSMRGSSMGLTMDEDATRFLRDKGLIVDGGRVKDVHVTKFQISIDELLQTSRRENPDKVTDAMKYVVVSVRRIMKDIDESTPSGDESAQLQAKQRAKVSAMANQLITASKTFAASAGMSPVSLLDASASHLTAAVVELLGIVKIRTTPADELDDEEEGSLTPVGSTKFFSPQRAAQNTEDRQDTLPPPPPFKGLGGFRASADSSAYSPVNSPRESVETTPKPYTNGLGNGMGNGMSNGMGYGGMNGNYPAATNGYGMQSQAAMIEDFKVFLSDQSALLVSDIQNLVGMVRGDAGIQQIANGIDSIDAVVGKIISETEANGFGDLIVRLDECRERLLEASQRGRDMANAGVETSDRDWRMWSQTLPPIAFSINRETKELAQRVDRLNPGAADDFS
ncbi:Protein SPA2 [Paramyrothecium foliicola]|nr:Protein SPA2 [Paramyrothecium foliicola]